MNLVLDSSAIVPILHDEKETDHARSFFDLCLKKGVSLSISPLVRCEVGNCIINFAKRERKDPTRYMERFLGIHMTSTPMDDELLIEAMRIARENGLTYYDAIHAAGAMIGGSLLVTLDDELLSKIEDAMDLKGTIEFLNALS